MPEFRQRRVSGRFLISFFFVMTIMYVVAAKWFIPSRVWQPLFEKSFYLLHPTLQGAVFTLPVMLGLLIGVAGMRPAELGFIRTNLKTGVLSTLAVWGVAQLTALFYDDLRIDPDWQSLQALPRIGELIAQLFGNAFSEEILWRGFLVVQCLIWLQQKSGSGNADRDSTAQTSRADTRPLTIDSATSSWKHLILATLIVTCGFAVSHVPNRIMRERYDDLNSVAEDQLRTLLFGVWYCWLYLRTGNLFFTVGVHALWNKPTMLFALPTTMDNEVILVLATLAGVFWHRIWRVSATPADTQPRRGSV